MKIVDLNEVVLIPSTINVLNQARTIQHIKNENKLLLTSTLLIVAIAIAVIVINSNTKTNERKEEIHI